MAESLSERPQDVEPGLLLSVRSLADLRIDLLVCVWHYGGGVTQEAKTQRCCCSANSDSGGSECKR